jgi:hypothetical protein
VAGEPKNLTARIARLIGIANESRERATIHGVVFELPTEAERQRARCILLRLCRWQCKRVGRKDLASVHPLVWQTVNDWGLRFSREPNPGQAWETFLGIRQRRGKRAKNAERDLQIAVAVARKLGASDPKRRLMKLEEACRAVKSEGKPMPALRTIENIYRRHSIAAWCVLAFEHWPNEANDSSTWEKFICEPR